MITTEHIIVVLLMKFSIIKLKTIGVFRLKMHSSVWYRILKKIVLQCFDVYPIMSAKYDTII